MDSPHVGALQPRAARHGGLGSRRVLWGSFSLSAGIHAVVLLGAALVVRVPRGETASPLPTPARDEGLEVVWILGVEPPPEAARPEDPEAIDLGGVPQVVIVRPNLGESGPVIDLSGAARPGVTAAEILRPGLDDERLWAPLPPEMRTLTLEQREELLLAGRIAEWNDSVAAAAAADAAWRDWTFTDGNGDRWGIADGQLHLGGVTVPLPFAFDAPVGQRDYMRQFEEIARQGANARVQQTLRERMEAIRARRDRERAAAQVDTTGR